MRKPKFLYVTRNGIISAAPEDGIEYDEGTRVLDASIFEPWVMKWRIQKELKRCPYTGVFK